MPNFVDFVAGMTHKKPHTQAQKTWSKRYVSALHAVGKFAQRAKY